MRLIHTCSGLLSIIGAAFLLATAHALIVQPVNLDAPVLTGADAPVVGDPNRANRNISPGKVPDTAPADPEVGDETESDPVGTPAGTNDGSADSGAADSGQGGDPLDALLDAPVPEGMLTLRQSRKLWEESAYFIDARHEDEYLDGHIMYASWLTATLFDTDSDRAFAVVESMPPDATVVIYCVGGECDASKNVAARLQQIGFTDLRVMGVGYEEWAVAGFETEKGQP